MNVLDFFDLFMESIKAVITGFLFISTQSIKSQSTKIMLILSSP